MELKDLERIRFTTQHFNDLQGFRLWAPCGLVIVGWGGGAMPVRAALSLAAVLLFLGASWYYKAMFGEVEAPAAPTVAGRSSVSIFRQAGPAAGLVESSPSISLAQRWMVALGLIPVVVVAFQVLFWPPWIELSSGLVLTPAPGGPLGPAAGALAPAIVLFLTGSALIAAWLQRGCRLSQSHLPALGALLLGVVLLDSLPAWPQGSATLILSGAALLAVGLVDHWQLVRALRRS